MKLPSATLLDRTLIDTVKSKAPLQDRLNNLYGARLFEPEKTITVYTDGSCIGNGKTNSRAGAGIFYGEGNARNKGVRVPGPAETNNRGEIYAIYKAVHENDPHIGLEIFTDSTYTINMLTEWGPEKDDVGWDVPNGDIFKATANAIKARCAPVRLVQVKGHSGNAHNDAADELAKSGA
ncbi:ribonuclease H-like domain-containing protein, partial [Coprinopsis sp. MPI-PUGE-AT-0042]